jgi:hypothetical protein
MLNNQRVSFGMCPKGLVAAVRIAISPDWSILEPYLPLQIHWKQVSKTPRQIQSYDPNKANYCRELLYHI